MKQILRIAASAIALFSTYAYAHHSFSPYAINDIMEISGIAESFEYVRPHPILVVNETDGRQWTIEITPRNWDNTGLPASSDVIKPGDAITVRGWPARNGDPEMVISGFGLDGAYYEVVANIRQRSAVEEAVILDGVRE